MTVFRFQDNHSPVHRLSPFCLLAWVLSLMVASLLFASPVYLAAIFIATLPMVIISGIWRQWLSLVFFAILIGFGIMVINALVINQGSTVLLESTFSIPTLGVLRVTMEAIFFALSMALRILVIVSAFAVFNFTVHPDDQILAMIQLKIPYKSVLVVSLATRFVPALFEDMDRLTMVQQARGLEIQQGPLWRKIKNRAVILVPLLANSLDRCIQIAEAMEARAFGQGKDRTYFKHLIITFFDIFTIGLGFLPLIWGIIMLVNHFGAYNAYANWRITAPSPVESTGLAVLLAGAVLLSLSGFLKRRIDLD
jgi:energy-coupling factor transport system permease protein